MIKDVFFYKNFWIWNFQHLIPLKEHADRETKKREQSYSPNGTIDGKWNNLGQAGQAQFTVRKLIKMSRFNLLLLRILQCVCWVYRYYKF